MTTTKVVYDYRCQPEEFEEDVTTPDTPSATVAVINTDGIDLPDVDPLPDDQRLELTAHDGLEAEQEQEDPSSSSTAFNSPLAWATPTPGDTSEEQLHVEGTSTPEQMTEEDSPPDDVDILTVCVAFNDGHTGPFGFQQGGSDLMSPLRAMSANFIDILPDDFSINMVDVT
ncbi:hypothetical protein FOZ60_011546 [Perkinsus olseni]|uniref:Uncharacterized protein n=1 Tax=Perkinsus olseni TaxID=32597 RepID=A0A7J6NFN6_PEROL|nr:hypothetical protein FOZ60_011546 [Perkinsus olseni]